MKVPGRHFLLLARLQSPLHPTSHSSARSWLQRARCAAFLFAGREVTVALGQALLVDRDQWLIETFPDFFCGDRAKRQGGRRWTSR